MNESQSITNNLLKEVDVLSNRLRNIKYSLLNSNNKKLKNRLIYEYRSIFERVNDIYKISNLLVISISKLEKLIFSVLFLFKSSAIL